MGLLRPGAVVKPMRNACTVLLCHLVFVSFLVHDQSKSNVTIVATLEAHAYHVLVPAHQIPYELCSNTSTTTTTCRMLLRWSSFFIFSSFLHKSLAIFVNVTVDDTLGDPITGQQFSYLPAGSWNVGQTCTACTARPDPSLLFAGTWHDGTFNPLPGSNANPNQPIVATIPFNGPSPFLISLSPFHSSRKSFFIGSAVYVFVALADSLVSPDGTSDMTFVIDDNIVGTFTLLPLGLPTYQYNVSVYSNTSLPAGPHTLSVVTGQVNGPKSLILLDYIVYT
jgi:hypothetical protein